MRTLMITLGLVSGLAFADDVDVNDCIIQEVLPGKHMTGAFVTFDNETEQPVVLEKAAIASLSDHVELHEMAHQDGVMKMQEIKQLELQPGETAFKKGGYHVMVMDIAKAPEIGSEYEMTFTFANGKTASCEAEVLSVDDVMEHFGGKHGDMDHNHEHSDMDHSHKHGDMEHSHEHHHDDADHKGHKHES
ncbi:copper chaperone PCu(A)C [Cardiobacteriaceae bacterium TAE3-ERU3]|nr:copper chaperone PCu(A)C [Cardiobacteriaceae bacterium TAE3-ERU3]